MCGLYFFLKKSMHLLQHIRMISEGSCDTKDWSNDCWKFSFAITGIHCILKYNKIEIYYFKS